MPTKDETFRIDFKQVSGKYDKKTGKFEGVLIPDPERYEWKTIDSTKYLYDKFDNLMIPELEFSKMIEKIPPNMPIYSSIPKIDDVSVYTKKRLSHIKDFLNCKTEEYKMIDKSEEFLKSRDKDEQRFVILTIDLKGSTKMSQSISEKKNAKIISLFAKEMAGVVSNYNGYVLKYVGDGLIAYFPEPNFIGMNDNAVDCAMCMKYLIKYGINKILLKKKFPKIKFRIGIDSGEAMIVDIGNSSIKLHKDLISETVNISSKIQSTAKTNGIVIGNSTARNLHTSRRKWFTKYSPSKWSYQQKDGKIYPLHAMSAKIKK